MCGFRSIINNKKDIILLQLLKENINDFVQSELNKIHKILYMESEEMYDDVEEPRKSATDAFLKITLYFLRSMKQEDVADLLESSKKFFFVFLLKKMKI